MKQPPLDAAALAAGSPPPSEYDHADVITELAKRLEHVRSVLLRVRPDSEAAPWVVRELADAIRGNRG